MSTFDDPFDADRGLSRAGCACGQHRSAEEHGRAAPQLDCEPAPSEEERYEGVVASAVVRAMFPQDVARRAFLKSVTIIYCEYSPNAAKRPLCVPKTLSGFIE